MDDPISILRLGLEQGVHPGAQIFVSHKGRVVLDQAIGDARPDVPMRIDSLAQWFSSGKPLTAVCIAQLYEEGALLLDDKVSRFIPEFGQKGKETITLWHLLTHTAGLVNADKIPRNVEWAEAIRLICASELQPDWVPGQKAGYSPQASWFVLAEIIQRLARAEFHEYIRKQLFLPLRMNDAWISLPPEEFARYGERVASMYDTAGGKMNLAPLQDAAGMATCRPGGSARGPVRQLARFYQMLLHGGELDGHRILKGETVRLFTSRHRKEMYDHTFMHTIDYGLGFILNSNRHGPQTVPYNYGLHASEETFGHSGAQSSCAFADPQHELVVAWVANGMPGEPKHQKRQRDLNTSIYRQLGLD